MQSLLSFWLTRTKPVKLVMVSWTSVHIFEESAPQVGILRNDANKTWVPTKITANCYVDVVSDNQKFVAVIGCGSCARHLYGRNIDH